MFKELFTETKYNSEKELRAKINKLNKQKNKLDKDSGEYKSLELQITALAGELAMLKKENKGR